MKNSPSVLKKLMCVLLSVMIVLSVSLISASAEPDPEIISGSFDMGVPFSDGSNVDTYYYSDSYFDASGCVSNEHLRTMSAAAAFTLRGTAENYDEVYGKLLREIGFDNITMYDMDQTNVESIGVVFAEKIIKDQPVVFVGIRSDKYEHEFASNVIVGAEDDALGFSIAKDMVKERLQDYLETNEITSAKFWVTGYSRGGAVANLLGRDINMDAEIFGTTEDDIYVYTFEAPNCSADDTVYENIHNIVDCRDIVAYVYPEVWGLYCNGVKEMIGDADEVMMSKKFDMFSDNYMDDYEEVKTADFVKSLVDFIGENISRETYSGNIEMYASGILNIFYELNPEGQSNFLGFFKKVMESVKSDSSSLFAVLAVLADGSGQDEIDTLVNVLKTNINSVAETEGKPVGDEDYEYILEAVEPVVNVAVGVLKADMAAALTDDSDALPLLYHILSFVGNLKDIIKNHYNSNIYSQLKAMDSYFEKSSSSTPDESPEGSDPNATTAPAKEADTTTPPTTAEPTTRATAELVETTAPATTEPVETTAPATTESVETTAPATVEPVETTAPATAEPTEATAPATYEIIETVEPVTLTPPITAPVTSIAPPLTEPATTEPTSTQAEVTEPASTSATVPEQQVTEPNEANSQNNTPAPQLKKSNFKLKAGKTVKIQVLNAGKSKITYKSTNKKVAIVKNNKIIALKKGKATIKVKVKGKTLKCKVKVSSSPRLNNKNVTVSVGGIASVKIIGKAKGVNNSYSKDKIAKVVSAKNATTIKVKGLKVGTKTLKITVNKVKLSLKVTVKKE